MGEIKDKEKVAELCGAIIGDGWIQADERCFFLAGDSREDKDYYDNHISKIISNFIYPVKPKEFPYWQVYGVSLYKKEAINKLLRLGLPKGRKAESASVPNWILTSNKKIIRAFIRGFFDTDGGIFCQKDYTKYATKFNSKYHTKLRLRMSSISEKLINQIHELLIKLDFRCVKRTIKRGFRNNRNNRDIHLIEINSLDNLRRFFEEISPSNLRHTSKYLIWKKFGFCPPNTTIIQRKDILKNQSSPYNLYKQE
nr:hypothetical protein [uncultured archaeon]